MYRKVALFDFDNTVATGDSIARLLVYDLKKRPWHVLWFLKVGIEYLFYLLHLLPFEKAKSTILFPLNSMDEDELKTFYQQCIEPTYYPNVVEEMQKKKDEDYIVILCTASCEAYMKYNQLPIDCLLGTQTQVIDNHASSQVIGKNCKDKEKINRILNYCQSQGFEIDYENSYGYSDSNSDIPMLSLVKHKKRVLLNTGEIIEFKE
ncbi:MAG: HAD family hydrolase [Longibaculum sp.]